MENMTPKRQTRQARVANTRRGSKSTDEASTPKRGSTSLKIRLPSLSLRAPVPAQETEVVPEPDNAEAALCPRLLEPLRTVFNDLIDSKVTFSEQQQSYFNTIFKEGLGDIQDDTRALGFVASRLEMDKQTLEWAVLVQEHRYREVVDNHLKTVEVVDQLVKEVEALKRRDMSWGRFPIAGPVDQSRYADAGGHHHRHPAAMDAFGRSLMDELYPDHFISQISVSNCESCGAQTQNQKCWKPNPNPKPRPRLSFGKWKRDPPRVRERYHRPPPLNLRVIPSAAGFMSGKITPVQSVQEPEPERGVVPAPAPARPAKEKGKNKRVREETAPNSSGPAQGVGGQADVNAAHTPKQFPKRQKQDHPPPPPPHHDHDHHRPGPGVEVKKNNELVLSVQEIGTNPKKNGSSNQRFTLPLNAPEGMVKEERVMSLRRCFQYVGMHEHCLSARLVIAPDRLRRD